jgi:hypothetical protein
MSPELYIAQMESPSVYRDSLTNVPNIMDFEIWRKTLFCTTQNQSKNRPTDVTG